MATQKKPGRPVPWSYSSLQQFETCPRRFYLTRIAKIISEPQTEATVHGKEVHSALELAVAGKRALPEKYERHQPIVDKLRATPGERLLEYKFALSSSLQPVDYWADNVWVRGVLDVGIVRKNTAIVLDYKTGKRKVDLDQLRLFALAGLSLWPHVETVKTGYVWLQTNTVDPETFAREQKVEIFRDFAARVHRMETSQQNNDWPPRPSGLCKNYCPVGFALCEHCGK
jgi:CRISPR/Cas system-associated exonuclease Cas4 (RecB family)